MIGTIRQAVAQPCAMMVMDTGAGDDDPDSTDGVLPKGMAMNCDGMACLVGAALLVVGAPAETIFSWRVAHYWTLVAPPIGRQVSPDPSPPRACI
ncbi:MAG: hypothetical protein EXQ85_04625 [Alphaproteobacteria bacterium]|nr:hypothetical protein [Alphaproteobacteria bacterium]